jgi:hypothetical protein
VAFVDTAGWWQLCKRRCVAMLDGGTQIARRQSRRFCGALRSGELMRWMR